jgi:hypothetical protein
MTEADSLAPRFQTVQPKTFDLLAHVELFDDALQLATHLISVGPPVRLAQRSLDVVEQLLDGVQPGRVLRVEQHVDFELAGCLVDGAVLVDRGVVHEHDHVFIFRVLVCAELRQQPVQEVFEYYGVCPAFRDLCRHHGVLSQCRYHRERIRCVFLCTLLPLDPGHLEWIANMPRNLSLTYQGIMFVPLGYCSRVQASILRCLGNLCRRVSLDVCTIVSPQSFLFPFSTAKPKHFKSSHFWCQAD